MMANMKVLILGTEFAAPGTTCLHPRNKTVPFSTPTHLAIYPFYICQILSHQSKLQNSPSVGYTILLQTTVPPRHQ